MNLISFIGAGPGDKELITLKGYKRLRQADIIIYAGSLINPELLEYCKSGSKQYDSSKLTLKEIINLMVSNFKQGKKVVRLQTGDLSIFGSVREQIEELKKRLVPYEIIAGVSSFLGAAASLGVEYTVPEISQTVIITRIAGRTPVPKKENLESLAKHQTSLIIFLSVSNIQKVTQKLLKGGYSRKTPAIVIYKATWPQEKIVRGQLDKIAKKTIQKKISKTALILVGNFLGASYHWSNLYNPNFSHTFREAKGNES